MRPSFLLPLLALGSVSVHAQYFSEGWKPGQAVTTAEYASNTFEASEPGVGRGQYKPPAPEGVPLTNLKDLLDINKVLKTPTSVGLFRSFGINITERVDAVAARHNIWDERIPLITDENYGELIVNETLTEEEEKTRVWALVVSSTTGSSQAGGISKFIDETFDSEFNETMIQNDLPDVRWGRINYLNVTYLTTKWSVWQAPMIIILQDRGQSLYFYRPNQLRIRDGALREFLQKEYWKLTPKWQSSFAPGGEREYVMEFIAVWMTKIFLQVERIPRWLFYMLSGSIASVVLGFLHRGDKSKAQKHKAASAQARAQAEAEAEAQAKAEKDDKGAKEEKEEKEKKSSKGRSGGAKLRKQKKQPSA